MSAVESLTKSLTGSSLLCLPIVRRFNTLRGLGVFRNGAAAAAPEFRRLNLIYGFNGCGKTTLSRVFASLEQGTNRPELPNEFFEVQLSDGTKLSSTSALTALVGRTLSHETRIC
jgi:wobble nucleotide-excising tRNase